MRILDCEQRSDEWYLARRGIPTASEFGNIITPKKGDYATAADTYINSLIDELVRPQAVQSFTGNRHTLRGEALEPEARELYAFDRDIIPRTVGFILSDDGTMGCSPDSLIDEDGGLEIKSPDGPTHVKWVRGKGIPDEHKPQVHGCLIITGRKWWDFMSYCPGYDPFIVRVVRDGFTDKLESHLARFQKEYAEAKQLFMDQIK
jgi:hypothetical protein